MLNNFRKRSVQPEMLDEVNIPWALVRKNLRELDLLNRMPGGHHLTLYGIKQLINNPDKLYYIVDLGCGSGDTMKYIASWARRNGYKVTFTGVDINPRMIGYLKEHCKDYPEITGVTSDCFKYMKTSTPIDIVVCSLFCHHLTDEQLLNLFVQCKTTVRVGFVVNDIKRSLFAFISVWLFTRMLFASKLAKNDGPVSVLRAFTKKDLRDLLELAEVPEYTLKGHWAFRRLVIGKTT